MPHERELAARLPGIGESELLVAELQAGPLVGPIRMRLREAHRHVHVVRIGLERTGEDRHDELRVDGVHDEVRSVGSRRLGHVRGISGIDLDGREAVGVAERIGQAPRP